MQVAKNVSFDAVINTDKKVITITPESGLAHTQSYYVAITDGYEDYSNNNGAAISATFKTVDLTPPVVSVTPVNDAEFILPTSPIYIQFDEPVRNLDNSELSNSNLASVLTLKISDASGSNVPFIATINAAKTIITIISDQLATQTTYYVSIGAFVEDYKDNPSAPASSTFTTAGSTGLEDNHKDIIKVYPNPGNGLFTLEFSSRLLKGVRVTDLNGRTVFEKKNVADGSLQLDLRNSREGLYFLYVEEAGQGALHTFKLIKQNGGK